MISYFILTTVILIALCWGSFLNVVAYRLAFDKPFFTKRSYCPSCSKLIAWYDNIPLLSWIFLLGKCRACKKKISFVYPLIELSTTVVMSTLFIQFFDYPYDFSMISYTTLFSFASYVLFFTALLVSTAMDFRAMVVSQLFTLWFVPIGLISAHFNLLEISALQSSLGALLGYGILWIIAFVFKRLTKKDGMGVGDMELLAMIGSFLGVYGVWASLMLGSTFGVIGGGVFLLIKKKKRTTRIPFGPFLSLGAILYFFFQETIAYYFF